MIEQTMQGSPARTLRLQVRAVVATAVVYAALLSAFAVFARTILNSFQKTEGLLLLSGRPREAFYEMWSITLPSAASVLIGLTAVCWICLKVFRSKWSKPCLLVTVAYILAFLVFQWFLVGLGFEAFD